jgi:5-(carboxyamino)imidazole ribonucleotide mutase
MANEVTPWVGIVMGSKSDLDTLAPAREVLNALAIPHEVRIISAHRTPDLTLEYAESAEARGLDAIIAAAGGAAHLAGVIAAKTILPVLGVPVIGWSLGGLDSLLSMVQMPKGVPVATFAIGKPGATNAALFAAQIIAARRPEVRERLRAWREARRQELLKETIVD